jgi:hypothetical protein
VRIAMLEEAIDPRPGLPQDLQYQLQSAVAASGLSAHDLACLWNDDVSPWANLLTVEHWLERARR